MTDLMMEIRHNEGVRCPLFGDDLALRDALSAYTRARWPTNTAKQMAREWDLSLDEAKGVIAGRTSQQTIDKIFKAGGWAVVLPVVGAVLGHGVDDFIAQERARLRDERRQYEARDRRLAEMGRDLRLGFGLGRNSPAELASQQAGDRRSRRG